MVQTSRTLPPAPERPRWNEVLRALREARGVTQDGWAVHIGVSRKTVQRWEAGERAPDASAEAAILAQCRERNLFRSFTSGPLAGLALTPETLHALLAEARFTDGRQREPRGIDDREPASAAEAPDPSAPRAPVAGPPPSNLPAPLTSFVGREREVAAVRRALGETRLLTLTGAGGVGKTRLALAVAEDVLREYPHGVWMVELAALAEPALVPHAAAAALGMQTAEQRPVAEALEEFLRPRQLLLILDNCEHLLPAGAALAEALLRACPTLTILATSREPLGVAGETRWRVPPMAVPSSEFGGSSSELEPPELGARDSDLPDSVRLFVERARQHRPDFALSAASEAAVGRICERLDGIPLAIELAAARVKMLAVEQIAERLADRFQLLTGGSRTALPRHQTLRATLDWSHDLLAETERTALRRLAVFAGGFDLEAAETVCREQGAGNREQSPPPPTVPCSLFPVPSSDVLDLLAALVDKSLVVAEEREGVARYRLLETVRQYAGERLDESGEAAPARERHLAWYLALAETTVAALQGPDMPAWLAWLEEEHDNLRAALAWALARGDGAAALRLAGALPRFWVLRGHMSEGRQWLAQALAVGEGASAALRAPALHGAGCLAYKQGDLTEARAQIERGLRLYQELGDNEGIAEAHGGLGCVALRRGEHDAARTLLDASLAAHTASGFKPGMASARDALGMLDIRVGARDAARAHFEASLALYRELGNEDGMAEALGDLATVVEDGDDNQKAALLEECLALYRALGNRQGIALAVGNLGMLAWEQRDLGRAQALIDESLALYRAVGDRKGIARLLGYQAVVALYRRDAARAAALCRESLALFRDVQDPWSMVPYLPVLAWALHVQGRPEHAARLYGAAAALREHLNAQLPEAGRKGYERAVAAVRAALGEAEFTAAWERGAAMAWEEAIADAVRASD